MGVEVKGPVCISPKRRNVVISNLIGAAAWSGNSNFLIKIESYLISKTVFNINDFNIKANEGEIKLGASSCMCKEFSSFTPIMLAIVAEHQNIEVIKVLIKNKANCYMKDDYLNTVLHLAAIYERNKVMKFIIE